MSGASVSGKIHFLVRPARAVRRVAFAVDGRVRDVDRRPPFAYGRAGLLDTAGLDPGAHRLSARVWLRGRMLTLRRAIRVRRPVAGSPPRSEVTPPTPAAPVDVTPAEDAAPGTAPAWADEFNGPAGAPPDSAKWGYDLGRWGASAGEQQDYTDRPANVSTDGRILMTGGQTGIVRLWDLPAGAALGAPLPGLAGFADTVDLAPDGSTAVGADAAGNVVLWDVPTRSTIGDPLPGPVTERNAAALFTPDGHTIVVVSDTGAGWVWDVDQADWLERACVVAGRSFTPQEWQEFLPDRPYHATCGS